MSNRIQISVNSPAEEPTRLLLHSFIFFPILAEEEDARHAQIVEFDFFFWMI